MEPILFLLIWATMLTSCTVSFQNISTHGTATDLVDEDMGTTADVSPNIQIPVKPL